MPIFAIKYQSIRHVIDRKSSRTDATSEDRIPKR
jgi:hypothetical protein